MALENVVWHDHVWPSAFAWDDDRRDDPGGRWRYDAVELEGGKCVVYSAEHGRIVEVARNRRHAITRAQELADKRLAESQK